MCTPIVKLQVILIKMDMKIVKYRKSGGAALWGGYTNVATISAGRVYSLLKTKHPINFFFWKTRLKPSKYIKSEGSVIWSQ